MDNFAGKTAFITGGASGLGLAMAKAFAGVGMNIVLADVEEQVLNQAVASFSGSNVEVLGIQVDVTDRDAMEQAAAQVEAQFGKVHVLCNNAGVATAGGLDEATYDDWDWVMGVNVGGVINGLQAFVKRIKSHGEGGHIINTASLAGVVGMAGLGVYNASKFAVVGMSEALAQDLAPVNIGVSVLCPGVVNTKIFESGRNRPEQLASTDYNDDDNLGLDAIDNIKDGMIEPEQVADRVLQAIRDNRFYIFTHPELKPMLEQRYQNVLLDYSD